MSSDVPLEDPLKYLLNCNFARILKNATEEKVFRNGTLADLITDRNYQTQQFNNGADNKYKINYGISPVSFKKRFHIISLSLIIAHFATYVFKLNIIYSCPQRLK